MASVDQEDTFFTVADGKTIGVRTDLLVIDQIDVNDLNANTINGVPIAGNFVYTDSVQTITNKTLVSPVISPNATITSAAAAPQTNTIPDVGNSNFVMTEGAQTINGAKTFTNVTFTGANMDTIEPSTPGAGVTVDDINIATNAGESTISTSNPLTINSTTLTFNTQTIIFGPQKTIVATGIVGYENNIQMGFMPRRAGLVTAKVVWRSIPGNPLASSVYTGQCLASIDGAGDLVYSVPFNEWSSGPGVDFGINNSTNEMYLTIYGYNGTFDMIYNASFEVFGEDFA